MINLQNKAAKDDIMKISSSAIKNGYFLDSYGGHGTAFNETGVPTYSVPFKIEEAPEKTKSFAVVLYDLDAFETTKGFPWIHWVIGNLTRQEILENESQTATDFVQGINSWHSTLGANQSKELSAYYGGMTPPDKAHIYTLKIIALDTQLDLKPGFFLNDLVAKMKGHILATAEIDGKYRKLD